MFPDVVVSELDVESTWAGVRPLIYEEGKDPSEISRKDEVWESKSGLITIAGGKLTGYRKMAEMVVDLIVAAPKFENNPTIKKICLTKNMPVSGGHVKGSKNVRSYIDGYQEEAVQLGFSKDEYNQLAYMYGSNIGELLEIAKTYDEGEAGGLPLVVFVQLIYSIQSEMTYKPTDFFIRRTGALYFQIEWVHKWKKPVTEYMAKELKWKAGKKYEYLAELEQELNMAMNPVEKG
jgi:glycerol-3-phosphate dehydrogenase